MRRRRNSRESEATPAPLLLRGRISIPMTALVQTLAVAEYLSFSAHSIVFIGLLPLATAIFGVLRGGERPRPAFWLFSCLGSALVAGFALSQGITGSPTDNLLMLAAIIVCGLGYAEGAKLSRQLGGWQVISWAPVLSLPIMLILTVFTMPPSLASISGAAWASLAYVSLFSMLIGFVFWYRGLAQGGIAAVGQLQLIAPTLFRPRPSRKPAAGKGKRYPARLDTVEKPALEQHGVPYIGRDNPETDISSHLPADEPPLSLPTSRTPLPA